MKLNKRNNTVQNKFVQESGMDPRGKEESQKVRINANLHTLSMGSISIQALIRNMANVSSNNDLSFKSKQWQHHA